MKRIVITAVAAAAAWGAAYASVPPSPKADRAFEKRQGLSPAKNRIYGTVKKICRSDDELNAMKFLYAYMPDPDIAAYSPEFILENVRASLKAREEMPWGKSVPDREFMHFVLPVRVNNEALDMSRPQFYEELKERVKGKSMADAILEVNHWCHEKVTYKPSDARTSSPLSSVSQAIGRCGEESTFAVAALRAVGIPARQIYTPRWAHTDDNHAWVEAWADGKWHFIGACEPEPVLDLAWFNAPASRGMLMRTNVFGEYDGPEEQLQQSGISTGINVTSNYAPVKTREVMVADSDGKPVADASVSFCIYNYAEFYPVVTRTTDASGKARLTTGIGDMIVWASDGKRFNVAGIDAEEDGTVVITLDKDSGFAGEMTFDITPPAARPAAVAATEAQKAENARRLAREDSIRNAYTATFCTRENAEALARELNLDPERLADVLVQSRGNHREISRMLRSLGPSQRAAALTLLEKVSEKDRRDIAPEVVAAQTAGTVTAEGYPTSLTDGYVLNPRVENERLVPFLAKVRKFLPEAMHDEFAGNPEKLALWIGENIGDNSVWNPVGLRMDPAAVAEIGEADPLSKKIFFVAAARSLGVPARMDLVRGEAQYADKSGVWHDVLRKQSEAPAEGSSAKTPKGTLRMNFEPLEYLKDPAYYTHFTLSRIVDGLPKLLEYPENALWSGLFKEGADLDAGQYMLVTGQRLADGGVLADVDFFEVGEGSGTTIPLKIREDNSTVSVIGNLDAETLYRDFASGTDKSILSTTGRGYYILGIVRGGHEPSVHTLNDISLLKGEFESLRGESGDVKLLLLTEEEESDPFDRNLFPNLPSTVVTGADTDGRILRSIQTSLNLDADNPDLPLFVIADTFNRIVFVSQGYTIGLGERLLRTLRKIN